MIGDSIDEINFTHKSLLTNRQLSKLRKAFPNYSSKNKIYQKLNFLK